MEVIIWQVVLAEVTVVDHAVRAAMGDVDGLAVGIVMAVQTVQIRAQKAVLIIVVVVVIKVATAVVKMFVIMGVKEAAEMDAIHRADLIVEEHAQVVVEMGVLDAIHHAVTHVESLAL